MAEIVNTAEIRVVADASGVEAGLRPAIDAAQRAERAISGIGTGSARSQQNLIQAIQRTTAEMEAGSRTGTRYFEVLAQQRGIDPGVLQPYLQQLRQVEQAQQGAGQSAGQTANALRQVPAQLTDIVTSLQGGMEPLTVLIQQGGQLRDSFGGIGPAARAMGGQLLALVNPFTVTAAAVAVLSAAYYEGSKEADLYRNSLLMTGNAIGLSAGQMADMAQAIGKVSGTQKGAVEALVAMVDAGNIPAERLQQFASVAIDLQKTLGTSVADTAKEFAELGEEPVEASERLTGKYHYLTSAVYEQIRALVEQGRTEEAGELAQNSYSAAMEARTKKIVTNLGYIESRWKELGEFAARAWDKMLDVGRKNDQGELNGLIAKQAGIQKNIAEAQAMNDKYGERKQKLLLAATQEQITAKQGLLEADKTAAEAEAARVDLDEKKIKVSKEFAVISDRLNGVNRQYSSDLKTLQARREQGLVTEKEYASLVSKLAAEEYKRSGAGRDSAAAAKKAAAERKEEARLLAELSGVTGSYLEDLSRLNGQYSKGNLSQERYVELVTELISKQPGAKKMIDETAKEMADYAKATAAANEVLDKELGAITKQIQATKDQNEQIGLSKQQISELEALRLETLATRKEENAVIAEGMDLTGQKADGLRQEAALLRELAEAKRSGAAREISVGVDLTSATELVKVMDALDESARQAAAGMESAFGRIGKTFGGLTTSISGLGKTQAAIAAQLVSATKNAGGDQAKITAATTLAAQQAAQAQIRSYGDMAAAGKGFFDEHSRGYQAMEVAEKTFRAFEIGLALKTMLEKSGLLQSFTTMFVASKGIETSATVASVGPDVAASMVKGQAAAVAGVAGQAQGDPYSAWARMAAMAATMAALGFAVSGIGGKGDTTAVDRQKATGTGSVFGDADAKSESITKAIQLSAANSNIELNYTAGMLRSLRAIESSIGGLGGILSQNGVSGSAPGKTYGAAERFMNTTAGQLVLGGPLFAVADKLLGGFLGKVSGKIAGAIFGGKTEAVDVGVMTSKTTVAGALAGGLNAKSYADMKKDGGWFRSDKSWTDAKTLGSEANQQFSQVIENMASAIDEAGKLLGIGGDAFTQRLNGFVVDIGKISTKDLKPDEIQKQLEAAFSKVGDDMARWSVDGLTQFQKVGEGALETLVRVAANYANLDSVLASIGKTFGATGLASIDARERLIELAGGIDELASKTAGFAQNFLTEAERLAPVQKYVADQMAAMNLSFLDSRAEFKDYVLGLDLTSESQRQQYVALMDLQEAYAKVYPEITDMTEALTNAKSALADAYNAEVDAIGATIDRLGSFATSLRNLGKNALLGGLSPLSPQAKYAEARSQYEAVAAAARGGDEKAQDRYQEMYTAFLEASRAVNASGTGYQRDFSYAQAMTEEVAKWAGDQVGAGQAQLAVLKAQVSSLIDINKSVLSVREALLQYTQAGGKPLISAPVPMAIPYYISEGRNNDVTAVNAQLEALMNEVAGLRSDQQRQTGDQISAQAEAVADSAVAIAKAVVNAGRRVIGSERVLPE